MRWELRIWTRGALAALLAAAVLSCGCAFRTSAAQGRGDAPPGDPAALPWPARRTTDLQTIADASPRRLFTRAVVFQQDKNGDRHRAQRRKPEFEVLDARAAGLGVIRVLATSERGEQWLDFHSWPPNDQRPDQLLGEDEINLFAALFSTRFMRLLPPGEASQSRGLAVHMRSLIGNKYEDAVIARLRARGWWVLEASVIGMLSAGVTVEVPSLDEKGLRSAAHAAAEFADLILGRRAYGVEAALEYLATARPEVPMDPIVAVGFSAGALGLPTAVARSLERFDAAVLIAGGVNLLEISQRSVLTDGGVRIAWPGTPTPSQVRRLLEFYIEASDLDPYHTAAYLCSIPVLQLHGMFDRVVPSSTGDALYTQLGRPERWSFPGGHGMVFWLLPQHAYEIADWLERAVANRRTPDSVQPRPDSIVDRAAHGLVPERADAN
jgi:hypothetical protein